MAVELLCRVSPEFVDLLLNETGNNSLLLLVVHACNKIPNGNAQNRALDVLRYLSRFDRIRTVGAIRKLAKGEVETDGSMESYTAHVVNVLYQRK